jgi:hypothetical protein
VADVIQMGNHYNVFFHPVEIPGVNAVPKNLQRTQLRESAIRAETAPRTGAMKDANGASILKRGNTFQSEFSDTGAAAVNAIPSAVHRPRTVNIDTDLVLNPFIRDSTYLKLKSQPYRLSFKPDFFQARLDNTILFTQYQSAGLRGNKYSNPSIGGLLSISLTDQLENHKFTGGIRLPVNFSGMTYFLQYQNFTKRIDWGVLFLRTANFYNYNVTFRDSSGNAVFDNPELGKVSSYMLQGNAGYPLDRRRRIGLTLGLRKDVLDFKAEDTFSLSFSPRATSNWVMSRLEYVFDNSIMPVTNIREGFRWKAYGEFFNTIGKVNENIGKSGGFYNLGIDFRYYKRLYRNSILAVRLASAHSEGNQHILYYLGGVDGWLVPEQSTRPSSPDQNYAFQALGTSLRGYKQGDRNGNSYALMNLELRIPILSTILNRPIQSSFLRNLQLCGFSDAGSAWNGWLPNTENVARTYNLNSVQTPVTLQVNTPSDGVALGYGTGIRTTVLGYFARLDAAWNIDGRTKPIWYFALGLDF